MAIDDELLKSFVLQTRLMLMESLLLKLHILVPKLIKPSLSVDESVRLTAEVLEETAADIERIYLRDERFAVLSPEERSLLADESRDVVETMKQHASLIAARMKEGAKENG